MNTKKVGITGSVMQSIGAVGPMLNVVGLFAIISSFWRPMWEVVLFAFLVSFLTVYTPLKISEKVTSNGGYYSYNGIAGRKFSGVFVSYIYLAYGFLVLPAISLFMAGVFITVMPGSSGFMFYYIPLIVMLVSALEIFIISRGMGLSIRYIEIFGVLEIAFLIGASVLMLIHGNTYAGNTGTVSFTSSGFWKGTLFGVLMFSGLGSSIFISENTKNSRILTGRSILIAYFATGTAMVFASYAVQSFLGSGISGYYSNPFILLTLIKSSFGGVFMYIFIIFALISSANLVVSYLNAFRNSIARMARDRIFKSEKLAGGGLSAIYIIMFLINGSLVLAFYFTLGSFAGFVILSGLVSLLFLSIHSISNITLAIRSFSSRDFFGRIIPPASTVFLAVIMIMSLLGSGIEASITDALFALVITGSVSALIVMRLYRKDRYSGINFKENIMQ